MLLQVEPEQRALPSIAPNPQFTVRTLIFICRKIVNKGILRATVSGRRHARLKGYCIYTLLCLNRQDNCCCRLVRHSEGYYQPQPHGENEGNDNKDRRLGH
jgi:hypothetical protein